MLRAVELSMLQAPCAVAEIDIESGWGRFRSELRPGMRHIWVLVGRSGVPVGTWCGRFDPPEQPDIPTVVARVQAEPQLFLSSAIGSDAPPRGDRPSLAVAVCTRRRPEGLERLLASLDAQDDDDFSVIVVDNDPVGDETADVVHASGLPRLDYVLERRAGLSRARNAALRASPADVIAWIDDDEVATEGWVGEIRTQFTEFPHIDAVSGLMLPAELLTDAQVWFEQYGGHNKNLGFAPVETGRGRPGDRSPYYPLPAFGTGGNMAVRTSVLRRLGGFNALLGAGSPTRGAEDTRMFTDILHVGGAIRFDPRLVTWHFHRRTVAELKAQMWGYGAGLTGYYASLVADDPLVCRELVRLLPYAKRDFLGDNSLRSGDLGEDFPRALLWANRRGLASGVAQYCRAWVAERRESVI